MQPSLASWRMGLQGRVSRRSWQSGWIQVLQRHSIIRSSRAWQQHCSRPAQNCQNGIQRSAMSWKNGGSTTPLPSSMPLPVGAGALHGFLRRDPKATQQDLQSSMVLLALEGISHSWSNYGEGDMEVQQYQRASDDLVMHSRSCHGLTPSCCPASWTQALCPPT